MPRRFIDLSVSFEDRPMSPPHHQPKIEYTDHEASFDAFSRAFGGVRKDVCLAYVPEVVVADSTIVHVGFALTKLDEKSAQETLDLFHAVGLIDQEFADPLAATDAATTQHEARSADTPPGRP